MSPTPTRDLHLPWQYGTQCALTASALSIVIAKLLLHTTYITTGKVNYVMHGIAFSSSVAFNQGARVDQL